MKRRTFLQSCAAGALSLAGDWIEPGQAAEAADLEEAFRNPPTSAQANTWWHWMNGNISEIGITRDLEAMKRVGISAFQLFQPGTGIPKGPVDYGSPEHVRLLKHAAREADRLGLGFAMHNCPGWSSSGGPWIQPELSMQVLTWTETCVSGGQPVNVALRQPTGRLGYYRDAMVIAFPSPGDPVQAARITSSAGPVDAAVLTGAPDGGVELRGRSGSPAFLQFEFAEPVEARSVAVISSPLGKPATGIQASIAAMGRGSGMALEVSDDGAQFRKVRDLASGGGFQGFATIAGTGPERPVTSNFPAVRAKYFRLVCTQERRISDVRVSAAPRIDSWHNKAGFIGRAPFALPSTGAPPPAQVDGAPVIDPDQVLDISRFMDGQGRLNWQVPAGNWTILRIGHTTTGAQNSPAPEGGRGLECDKFRKAAIDFHFEQFFGKLFDVIAPLAAKGQAGAVIDSYETGMQNWTPEFPQEFQKRRGYDLRKYIPAMFGRLTGSTEISERFLWDVRKTQAELMNEYYYGRFAELCHQHGMKAFIEPYDPGNFDEMPSGSFADMPMGEFWLGQANHHSIKLAASVGHLNSRPVIGAESFTGVTKWQEYPYCMKATGDFMYTQGLNRYIFHRFAHQPHPDVTPGMTMGPWGWFFDRTNTWFDKAGTWLRYVARAQSVLRQGLFVADLLYFTGEDSPVVAPALDSLNPPPPPGYDWDTVDAGTLLKRLAIADGRIVLPDGMSYRVLVLRDSRKLSLAVLRRIRDLVDQGMILVGPKPEQSPSLSDDEGELRRIAAEIWGDLDGAATTERPFGRGRVCWGRPLRDILDGLGVPPDFEFTAKVADAPINYIHRRAGDADVYFLANRRRSSEDLVCTFRVVNKRPEFWNVVTGEMAQAVAYEVTDGRVRVPVHLEPAGSLFVVFREAAPARRVRAIAKDGAAVMTSEAFEAPAAGRHRDISNNFTVSVWVKPDLNASLPTIGGPPGSFDLGAFLGTGGYAIYPPAGEKIYGAGHAAAGLNAGRNGVVLYERTSGPLTPVLSVRTPLAGWTHLTVVYKDGIPSVYVDGVPRGQGKSSGKVVHPGLGEAYQHDGALYFMGHMGSPELFPQALGDERIRQLAAAAKPAPADPPVLEASGSQRPGLLFWTGGRYSLTDNSGHNSSIEITGLPQPIEIAGPWRVTFPPNLGAPPEVAMTRLVALSRHSEPGVKYFSGTATYSTHFAAPAGARDSGKRLFLDLGWVEMLAEVKLNGKEMGGVWKPPYRLDISDVVRSGVNDLEIRVTNQWTNRLIGDEQLPPEYEYETGGEYSMISGPGTGPIKKVPEWYAQGKPRPKGQRVAFAMWRHYPDKNEPLLESGLIGPVRLRFAIYRTLDL